MSKHRILGCEADQPKPLAYIRMYPPGRRRFSGVLAAALLGGALAVAGIAAFVMMGGF